MKLNMTPAALAPATPTAPCWWGGGIEMGVCPRPLAGGVGGAGSGTAMQVRLLTQPGLA
jgi:hypothetical protein